MSLLDRINAIHPSLITKQFSKKRDAFLKLEDPTKEQIDAFEAEFKDTEDKQTFRTTTEANIVRHWKVYQSIINDPRYPKDEPDFIRSEGRLKKGFAGIKIENDAVIEGKVNTGVLKDVTSDALKTKWEKFIATGGTPAATATAAAAAPDAKKKKKKVSKKRPAAESAAADSAVILSLETISDSLNQLLKDDKFILVIGVNPQVSKAVDDLKRILAAEGEEAEGAAATANDLWSFLRKNIPSSSECQGEDCSASNTKLVDGFCAACLCKEVSILADSITDRFNVYKEEYDIEIVKRTTPKAEKDALKQRFNMITELRSEHDEKYVAFESFGGVKGYAAYKAIYDKLDKILPTKSLDKSKRSRHFEPNDEAINSDESEASDPSDDDGAISHSGGDSEYQEDSSSSHSGGAVSRKRRAERGVGIGQILDFFSPVHSEIDRLAKVYKAEPENFAKEFEDTKKNRMTRYKVVPVFTATGKDTGISFDEPTIFITEESAKRRGEEACIEFDGTFTFRIIVI